MKRNFPFIIGIFIFGAYFFSLLLTLKDTGIFWDEPAYFQNSLSILDWFKNPSWKTLDTSWGQVQLSPPLEKLAQGISIELFHNQLGIMGKVDSLKFPNMIFASLTVLAVYFFALKYFNLTIAISSSLFLVTLPRFFGHAHLGALDIPLTLFIFLGIWAFWKNKDKNLLLPALFLGLALLTKMAGLLFLLPLALFYLIKSFKEKIKFKKITLNLTILFSVPIAMLFLFWPKLWVDPIKYGLEFFSFFSQRDVPFMYFGQTYTKPPWHFPFVMLAITTPVPTLTLAIIGIVFSLKKIFNHLAIQPFNHSTNPRGTRDTRDSRDTFYLPLFLLLNFLFLPLLLSLPKVSVYDAERLLLPSFPFLALLAGIGGYFVIENLKRVIRPGGPPKRGPLVGFFGGKAGAGPVLNLIFLGGVTLLFFISPISMLLHYYPYELSSYNLLIGGLKGAEKSGMEPQYTLESYKSTLPFLNQTCPKNCFLFAHSNVSPYFWYQDGGLLRKDIRLSDNYSQISKYTTYYILPIRKSLFYGPAAGIYNNAKPVFSYQIDGVSLVNVYKIEDVKHFLAM